MLNKLLALAIGFTVIGHLFFRPRLKQLGHRIDSFVTWIVIAIVISWLGQVAYFFFSER